MAKTIRTMDDLNVVLLPIMKEMVEQLTDKVEETLNFFLQEYYTSYEPKSYVRRYDFLRSAVKVKPKLSGNKATASVYIDTDYMDNYYQASGLQVASWANEGLHGGLKVGTNTPHVWDDTMKYTVENGELLEQAIHYLRSKGIPVQVR